MKTPFLKPCFCFSILALAIALVSCEKPVSPQSAEVKALHQERIETLRSLVQIIETQFNNGKAPTTNVLEAKRNLLIAQLDGAESVTERITLREELLKNLEQFEQLVSDQVDSGAAPASNLLEVRAARIKAEIELAEERE